MSHLFWGGADCVKLAERFGTPLYVLDEAVIQERCSEVRRDFLSRWKNTTACYAGKAFLTRAMVRLMDREGRGLDVVSLGELHTALSAGFPPERIELHGNAKSVTELTRALEVGVGRIIVDSPMELEVLGALAEGLGRRARILLRVAPGISAHTHAYITTGQTGSKFGIPVEGNMLTEVVKSALSRKGLELMGLHFHVGSQIFEPDVHRESVVRVVEAASRLKKETGFEMREINFGGGYGARVNPSEPHVPLALFTDAMMGALEERCAALGLECPSAAIETGRWIVSEAGITLYRVETVKELPGVTYVAVDGGMADNPRHPLYNALYDAVSAERPHASATPREGTHVSLVGKCCESGDVLIEDSHLPAVRRGEILAVYNTGAYTFSMAGNYNRLCRPAVVLVHEGMAELMVKRQTPDDLLSGDLIPNHLA